LQLDAKPPSIPLEEYLYSENRYRVLTRSNPEQAEKLLVAGKRVVDDRFQQYQKSASSVTGGQ